MDNAVLRSLRTRRSVRAFRAEQVEAEALQAVLEAGTYAATGRNMQSPIILAVQDPTVREQLRRL